MAARKPAGESSAVRRENRYPHHSASFAHRSNYSHAAGVRPPLGGNRDGTSNHKLRGRHLSADAALKDNGRVASFPLPEAAQDTDFAGKMRVSALVWWTWKVSLDPAKPVQGLAGHAQDHRRLSEREPKRSAIRQHVDFKPKMVVFVNCAKPIDSPRMERSKCPLPHPIFAASM
jgi:hypothetical protein